jgi:hypothetical protein
VWNNFFGVEILVIFAESVLIMLLFRIGYRKAFAISLVANFLTALIGLLIFF